MSQTQLPRRVLPGAPHVPSEIGEQIQTFDWSATPLGPAESWSPALRTLVEAHVTKHFSHVPEREPSIGNDDNAHGTNALALEEAHGCGPDALQSMAEPQDVSATEFTEGNNSRPRVLLVEDKPDIRQDLTRLLAASYEVETAASAEEALAACANVART